MNSVDMFPHGRFLSCWRVHTTKELVALFLFLNENRIEETKVQQWGYRVLFCSLLASCEKCLLDSGETHHGKLQIVEEHWTLNLNLLTRTGCHN